MKRVSVGWLADESSQGRDTIKMMTPVTEVVFTACSSAKCELAEVCPSASTKNIRELREVDFTNRNHDSFAIHLLPDGYDIRTVQELLGKEAWTTLIYAYILNRGGSGVRSPADGLVRCPDECSAETAKRSLENLGSLGMTGKAFLIQWSGGGRMARSIIS
jgi:hypothetical protein